jgi:hypothetical protein
MYRIGPHSELIGQAVDSYSVADTPPVEIELIRSGSFYSRDRHVLVPCFVEGKARAPAGTKTPVELAVAVNGTIWATTRTYLLNGYRDRWAAMVPERAYREGENDVRYYAISSVGSNLCLVPCRTTGVATSQ